MDIYEIALNCGHDIGIDAMINALSLNSGNKVLVIDLSSVNHSMLCSFAVSDINQRLTSTFESQHCTRRARLGFTVFLYRGLIIKTDLSVRSFQE